MTHHQNNLVTDIISAKKVKLIPGIVSYFVFRHNRFVFSMF